MKHIGDFSRLDNSKELQHWLDMLEYFDDLPTLREWREHSIAALGIRSGMQVLDAGCGAGGATRYFAQYLKAPGRIVGVDLSEGLIALAEERKSSPVEHYQCANICQPLPFDDDCFDAIRCDRVLHHTEHPDRVLTEFKRVLKPGGRIIFSEPDFSMWRCEPAPLDAVRQLADAFTRSAQHARIGIHLPRLLSAQNFDVLSVKQYGIVIQDFFMLDHYFSIEAILKEASDHADDIIAAMKEANQQGTFISVFPQFSVLAEAN